MTGSSPEQDSPARSTRDLINCPFLGSELKAIEHRRSLSMMPLKANRFKSPAVPLYRISHFPGFDPQKRFRCSEQAERVVGEMIIRKGAKRYLVVRNALG